MIFIVRSGGRQEDRRVHDWGVSAEVDTVSGTTKFEICQLLALDTRGGEASNHVTHVKANSATRF